jgi:hypothetical protein
MLALVAVGSTLYYRAAVAPAERMLQESGGELEWLRREFALTDAQFAAVSKAHHEYAPVCEQMCARIAEANARAERLIRANRTVTPEVSAALEEIATVREECRAAMLGHIYAVAAHMTPEQGGRYVEMMKGRVLESDSPVRIATASDHRGKE